MPLADDTSPPTSSSARRRHMLRPALIGLAFLLVNIALFWLLLRPAAQDWLANLGHYSYLGAFLITLVANATVVVPVPYASVLAAIAARSDNLALLIFAGALGSVLGESVAFFVGRSGSGVVEDTRFYRWIQHQMRHPWRAFAILFGLSAPPNPAFDVAGLAAGALGLPYWLFFSAVLLGRVIRVGVFVLVGLRFGG